MKYKKTLRIAGICIICWLYALAFAALASSCSGEDESAGRNMAKTALLRLNVSGTGAASTRATAAALPENESAVHRLAIGLFYADVDFLPYMKYYKPKSSKRFSKNLFLYRQSIYRYNIHL